jgi:transposase
MIEAQKRKAIFLLHEEGMGIRKISAELGVSRNAVRAIIHQGGGVPSTIRRDKIRIDEELLRRLHAECDGWKQRIHERLREEEGIEVTYPTLTRLLRELGIGTRENARCDRVPDTPGSEMQHDTTVYRVKLGAELDRVVASLLYLRYSKRRYLRFYRVFNRFRMRCFLHEGLTFWGHSASICVIDNTNLARLRGTGKDAVIVPEMVQFAKQYGFIFLCHEKGHANRKAGEERSFWTVETNFLPGRSFESLEDLNRQAFEWATVRMEGRAVAKSGLIPAQAFEAERSSLRPLLAHLPAPYQIHERETDQYGYVSFGGNFYWVPGTRRIRSKVLEYADRMKIYQGRECVAEYALLPDGVRNQRVSPEGFPQPRFQPKNRKQATAEEEKRLRAMGAEVEGYLDFALKPKGSERHRLVRELFRLSEEMTSALFLRSVERALKYRITSLETIRRIAILQMSESLETLPFAEVDEGLEEREAYREGRLSEAPDLSIYDHLLETDDG